MKKKKMMKRKIDEKKDNDYLRFHWLVQTPELKTLETDNNEALLYEEQL